MKTDTIKATAESAEGMLFRGGDWFDPLEARVRTRIRGFIEEMPDAMSRFIWAIERGNDQVFVSRE